MQERINRVKQERKLKGLRWADLAKDLPISGEGIRIAFYRNSVDPLYLDKIEETIGLKKSTQKEENIKEGQRFEEIVAEKVIEKIQPILDELVKSNFELKMKLEKIENELKRK
ncbi:hypothetical protein C8P64_1986 [Christiangramia gaetbulicola]|uniref:HTH cro/C1-type domain-containing protein n=1 Tax=Christiangramia gaetbulicola TaxID=703340 RepID=A0A2T6AI13_9FLAO|nr:hypothetical protein [Christiangramia gaetbulicola]PTX43458.1 hypothetical protein C8P64_1986 [Christiangramia gaetbulicola]